MSKKMKIKKTMSNKKLQEFGMKDLKEKVKEANAKKNSISPYQKMRNDLKETLAKLKEMQVIEKANLEEVKELDRLVKGNKKITQKTKEALDSQILMAPKSAAALDYKIKKIEELEKLLEDESNFKVIRLFQVLMIPHQQLIQQLASGELNEKD